MRVALYARVSTQEQAIHGLSIEAQTAALEEWAKPFILVGLYKDEGISARQPILKRPALQRLLRDVEAGKIDVIAFTKLDRWTRNIREYYKAQDVLDAHNVAWRAILEDYETESASGRLKTNLMLAIAQDESDRTSERVKMVVKRKREKGEAVCGSCPLGMSIVDKKLVPNEDADKVRQLFSAYIDSRSLRQTVRFAQTIGLSYTLEGLSKLLDNEIFVKSGIIKNATFQKAREIKATRSQRNTSPNRVYLFTGLVYCKECGHRMSAHTAHYDPYYLCPNHANNSKCNNSKTVKEPAIEEYLLAHLVDGVQKWNKTVKAKKEKKVDKQAIKKRMDKLTDLYMNDLIDRNRYEEEYRGCQSLLNNAEPILTVDEHEVVTLLREYQKLDRTHRKAFWSRVLKRIDLGSDGEIEFTVSELV